MTAEEQLELLNFQIALGEYVQKYSKNKNENNPSIFADRWYRHISKCDERKIIQVIPFRDDFIYLCSDGTLWRNVYKDRSENGPHPEVVWYQLPSTPK